MTTANAGKWPEAQVRAYLEETSINWSDFAYHRFPDARSARGALAPQPADFLVAARGTPWHLEVKETAKTTRLPVAKIRQIGMLQKYWWAGIKPVVVVYMTEPKLWCAIHAHDLFPEEGVPKSYNLVGRTTYAKVDTLLQGIFNV